MGRHAKEGVAPKSQAEQFLDSPKLLHEYLVQADDRKQGIPAEVLNLLIRLTDTPLAMNDGQVARTVPAWAFVLSAKITNWESLVGRLSNR